MQKIFRIAMLAVTLIAASLSVSARMTDDEVLTYVKQSVAMGKTQQQIGRELLAKGVTQEQVERLRSRVNDNSSAATAATASKTSSSQSRTRRPVKESATGNKTNGKTATTTATKPVESNGGLTLDMTEINIDVNEDNYAHSSNGRKIFGHNVFNNESLTFEPNENMATPQNYRLGPGDEVVIDIWGAAEDHIREVITPEGNIMVSLLGPIYLNGKTISEANKYIKNRFTSKYAGIGSGELQTDINVTLGQIRTIQVDVMGEVEVPGTYRLSPFSTVFHALYKSGGINDIGTLRNIGVIRNGKRIATVDVYDYLFSGKQTGNVRLHEGDVIIVPPYDNLIDVVGNVKRPMSYEIKDSENLAQLIEYAGGFAGNAYTEQVKVTRQSGNENQLFNIVSGDFNNYKLVDGDVVTVGTILDRYANRVELKGSVMRPGMYALAADLRSVADLLGKAQGLTEDAYTTRALLYREGPDMQLETIPLDVAGILSGNRPDVTLKRNDVIVIPSVADITDRGTLSINGMVKNAGDYPFTDNTTIEDLIVQAGGLLRGASEAKIDVSRRLIDPLSLTPTDSIAQVFTFSLKDGLVIDNDPGFILQPYDVVEVRKSPGFSQSRRVTLRGEVTFDGGYMLQNKNERLSTIIKRAGGVTSSANIKGAKVMRKMTDDEKAVRNETFRLSNAMQSDGDSINISKLALQDTYSIAINLTDALANPGSDADLVLQDGDEIIIPERVNTVKITGDVMFPNTITYQPGKKFKYYIEQAGGYGNTAQKNKAYIIYMNGNVAIAKRNTPIEPGCQIVVPTKPESNGFNWNALLSSATALGSVATMAATVANFIKR